MRSCSDFTIIVKFQMMYGITHSTLYNKTKKETRIKFYKIIAVPVLLYAR